MRSRSRGDSRILRLLTGPHQRRPPAPLPGPAGATPIEARRGRRFSFAGRAGARPAKSVAPAAEEDQEHTFGVLVFDASSAAPDHRRRTPGSAVTRHLVDRLIAWRREHSPDRLLRAIAVASAGSRGWANGGRKIPESWDGSGPWPRVASWTSPAVAGEANRTGVHDVRGEQGALKTVHRAVQHRRRGARRPGTQPRCRVPRDARGR